MEASAGDVRARKQQAARRVQDASRGWVAALRAHRLAPPDPAFADRLQTLGEAAAGEEAACREAHAAGLVWRPLPGAERAQTPYELRPGTGRRGPDELWDRFDVAVLRLNQATGGADVSAVGDGFGQVSAAALALAEAVREQDAAAASPTRRRAG